MVKVKKSVKKFIARGPDAAKKAVRKNKFESAKRQKSKAALEHKALAGTGKKKQRDEESDSEEEGAEAPTLEGMNVDAFMEGLGASSGEDEEEGENDTDEGSQGENDAEDDEDSDEEEAGELEASGAAEDSNSDLAEESDEEVADAKEALKKHKVRVPNVPY